MPMEFPIKTVTMIFFLVIPDNEMSPIEVMQKARKSLIALKQRPPVDILADYKSRFDDRKKYNTLERKISNEGVVLYERT